MGMPVFAFWLLFVITPASIDTGQDSANSVDELVSTAAERLLAMQEGEPRAEWPYEGVYRVPDPVNGRGRVIPIGYRVGGTSICACALMNTPGFDVDDGARGAVDRAARFVIDSIEHPLMAHDEIIGTYDVRGWGYTYGLLFLFEYMALPERGGASDGDMPTGEELRSAIEFFIAGISATEIPDSGGWNYARRGGFDQPGPMSPFMTAPTLQALFVAREAGYDVDEQIVDRGLDALERAKLASGAYVYSGTSNGRSSRSQVPGAAARMAAAEATLFLAGRSTISDVRGAIDAFIVHWDWLDQRRAQTGTHVAPYGIAPYYFYFGHYYAAQAVELLPEQDRDEYRRRLRDLLVRNRLGNGTWNDRVFDRSANFGTAMAMMTLMMDRIDPPPSWDHTD